jgi:hypothetical protein
VKPLKLVGAESGHFIFERPPKALAMVWVGAHPIEV